MTIAWHAAARVVTCDPAGVGPLGVIEDGVVGIERDRVVFVGPRAQAPEQAALLEHGARVITPGLVDAHTHACWVGSRHDEYVARLRGRDYRAIAEEGGGIAATQSAVAHAPEERLAAVLGARLRRMLTLGVTTVEVKSGYGLDVEIETKQLRAIARASELDGVPCVVPTLLALHALPHGADTDRDGYVARAARELVPEVARAKLARWADAYVDAGAFLPHEARRVASAARAHGLGLRFHVGQFADVGGAELAASMGAASADHLEHVSPSAIEALARAGTRAVLLPVASFFLGQAPPPVEALRKAGVPLVVASDSNPGTAPTESLPLALALAVRLYAITPEEAILGATREAALALAMPERGVLRVGSRADLVVWDLPHEHAIVQPWGVSKTQMVVLGGRNIGGPAAEGGA